jgi:hypothetical protein
MESVLNQRRFGRPSVWSEPLFIRVYDEALARRQHWQSTVQQALCAVLGLSDTVPFDPESVPSAAEIRSQVNKYLPPEVKLSSLVTALREE